MISVLIFADIFIVTFITSTSNESSKNISTYKKQLLVLDSSDNFWNEERIKKSRKSLLCDLNVMVKSRS